MEHVSAAMIPMVTFAKKAELSGYTSELSVSRDVTLNEKSNLRAVMHLVEKFGANQQYYDSESDLILNNHFQNQFEISSGISIEHFLKEKSLREQILQIQTEITNNSI